ncbi:MAG: TolC family protein [Polyangiaceae bacterium]
MKRSPLAVFVVVSLSAEVVSATAFAQAPPPPPTLPPPVVVPTPEVRTPDPLPQTPQVKAPPMQAVPGAPPIAPAQPVVPPQGIDPAAPPPAAPALPEKSQLDGRLDALFRGGKGLTSDEAAKRAEETSLAVRAKQQSTAAADAKVDQAKFAFLPQLTGSARYTRLSPIDPPSIGGGGSSIVTSQVVDTVQPVTAATPLFIAPAFSFPVFLNQIEFKAALSIPLSDYVLRISEALAAASSSRRAAEVDELAARAKAASDARISYYNWVRARGQRLVAEASLEQANLHAKDATSAFEVGMVSRADVLRAESQKKNMELLLERTKTVADLTEEQLVVAMHDKDGTHYEIGEDILADLTPLANTGDVNALVKEAFDRRLEVRALDETKFMINQQERSLRAAYYPRLDGAASVNYSNPNQRIFPQQEKFTATWDASLVLTWTPTEIPAAMARVREAQAKQSEIEAQKAALADGLRLEVSQAWRSLRETEIAVATSGSGLASAEEAYRVRRDLYQNGKATLVEVTDAETDLTRARLESINARIEHRVARVRLLHAVGRDAAHVPPRG